MDQYIVRQLRCGNLGRGPVRRRAQPTQPYVGAGLRQGLGPDRCADDDRRFIQSHGLQGETAPDRSLRVAVDVGLDGIPQTDTSNWSARLHAGGCQDTGVPGSVPTCAGPEPEVMAAVGRPGWNPGDWA